MVSRRLSRLEGHRRKFLAVIDDTPECQRAVHYAGMRAKNSSGAVVLLYVIANADFQQWLHDTPLPQIQAWVLAQQAK